MPNWVYNNLSITDPSGEYTADVARLVEQVGANYKTVASEWEAGSYTTKEVEVTNPVLSFWNIKRPEGEELEKWNASIGAGGAHPFWYDWSVDNWGVKWDASDVDRQDHADDHKQYTFSTPWSPPISVLVALSEQYPNLHIELEWEEEQGFGGTFVFTEGNATETEWYDIPSSHAEYEERGKTCSCDCYPEDPPFTDCPEYVPEDARIPADELEVEALL
jgi:Ferredoxin-like domain in Api92-like protein